ncbi:MAG: DUF805 domain-containing protein [Planctomycetota bacterium]
MHWYIKVLKKYAVFSGRARRKEYWLFTFFSMVFSFALGLVDVLTGLVDNGSGYGLLGGLYALAVFVPTFAVFVRRLHDTTRSGWWFLIGLIPIIGTIVLIVFLASDSETRSNRYGPNPKNVAA